jgi:glutathione S-transferase
MAGELAGKPWCCGNDYSLADISLGCCLGWLAFRFPEIDWRTKYPSLAKHFAKLSGNSAYADTAPRA